MPATRTRTEGPSIPPMTSLVPTAAFTAWANDASKTTLFGAARSSQLPWRTSRRPTPGIAGVIARSSIGDCSGPCIRVAAVVA